MPFTKGRISSAFNLANNQKRIFFHIAYWTCVVLFFSFWWGTRYYNYWVCFYNELAFLPVKIGVVYFSLYILIPRLLFKKKYLLLVATGMATMFIGGILQRMLAYYSFIPMIGLIDPKRPLFDPTEILLQVININTVMIIPFSIKLYSYSLEKENRILSLLQEKTHAELQFLRSQIQPHFLFNVLNDLYAMALKQSDKTAELILKLSDLMRYVLHESTVDVVPVEKEISYLRNYIDLEKLRYDKRFSVTFNVIGDTAECHIAPLLLLPFVENAFKHSTTNELSGAWINIELHISSKELYMHVANSYNPKSPKNDSLSSGIGIQNIRQRLDILYHGCYSLDSKSDENTYISNLIIHL
jgi:hypothetical protein